MRPPFPTGRCPWPVRQSNSPRSSAVENRRRYGSREPQHPPVAPIVPGRGPVDPPTPVCRLRGVCSSSYLLPRRRSARRARVTQSLGTQELMACGRLGRLVGTDLAFQIRVTFVDPGELNVRPLQEPFVARLFLETVISLVASGLVSRHRAAFRFLTRSTHWCGPDCAGPYTARSRRPGPDHHASSRHSSPLPAPEASWPREQPKRSLTTIGCLPNGPGCGKTRALWRSAWHRERRHPGWPVSATLLRGKAIRSAPRSRDQLIRCSWGSS